MDSCKTMSNKDTQLKKKKNIFGARLAVKQDNVTPTMTPQEY